MLGNIQPVRSMKNSRPQKGDPCCFHDVKLGLLLSSLASATLYNSTSERTVAREAVFHAAEGIQR